MRHTRSHTGNRRSHHALKGVRLSTCKDCGKLTMRHQVCQNCGKYMGRQILDVAGALAKKEKKIKERNKAMNPGADQKAK